MGVIKHLNLNDTAGALSCYGVVGRRGGSNDRCRHYGERTMRMTGTRRLALAGIIAVAIGLLPLPLGALAAQADDPWPGLAEEIFHGRPLADGSGLIALDMPYRAEDAAIVPLTIRTTLPAADARTVRTITVVIDENPAPLAATFELGAKAGVTEISTRVRVNSYTHVHAVAELSDGSLYAVQTFVKASGGCSAPALKNADAAKATIGQMRLRHLPRSTDASAATREAQVMLRHPNNSGLQMDQVTRLYVPAFFVRDLRIFQGDDLVLAMVGGISISEDPNIRFNYVPIANGAASFRVEAIDTEEHVYKAEWPASASDM
jgi:sulfur-oxidizing protein SoxY